MSFSSGILILFVLSTLATLAPAQKSYNSKNEICCNGTVHAMGGAARMGCCGQEPYDYVNFRCCGCGQVLDIFNFDPMKSISSCLLGRSTLYDHRTQTCCDGLVFDKQEQHVDYGCCNGQPFDKDLQRCCGENLLEKRPDEECCGNQTYDRKSDICCAEYSGGRDKIRRVAARTSNTTACCGLQTYDFRTHVCCDEVVMPKKEGMGEKWTSSCCNGDTYDKTKQLCCRRTGKSSSNTYVYLESVLHDMDNGSLCCGTLSYDHHQEICCSNYTITKPEGAPWDQKLDCCGGQPVTNRHTQTCVKGQIIEREDRFFSVCGDQMYDRRTHRCCGQQVFDPQTHACCGRRVYERGSNRKCCYVTGEVYDGSTHVCCVNALMALSEEDREAEHDACCQPWYIKPVLRD